ncbi:Amino acid ABC transporter (glutamate), amino acid-binding/permease protein [Alteracholeplasma palmae J233]|uniref:Amino acid ABC transporter (Glutamate), amino acid-binding/permease protein n=1 Tax=Alteracholeplasma palmae (strain ATCC 49389 / J233) TaxID=1318466 RepID=U4KRA7_ALTPJ|nr:transporter substrate-binding domain-containing protein [Alteracholeplasma palmae]CCV63996.1 Amino acid ABC transporter (glutamate), amino acid-binding/permease protein [Alteracholeplasma palmae J233]
MKKVLSLFAVLIAAVILVACNKAQGFDFEKGYIVVGMEADYPPFNWEEGTSNDYNHPIYGTDRFVAGYDVNVAKKIANDLGLELRIKSVPWGSLVPALTTGEIDLIVAGMSPTEDRKISVNFTNPYYISNHVVVVKSSGSYADITQIGQLNNAKGVGQIGTIYADLVDFTAQKYGAVALPVRDTVPFIVNDIIGGSADFTIVEKPVALGMIKANAELKIVLDVQENIFEVSNEDRELSIGVRKGDDDLLNRVNAILEKIDANQRTTWMEQAVNNSAE